MKILTTGSRAHRVWRCPPSAVLPQIDTDDDGFEPARGRGHQIHAYLERVKVIGVVAAMAEQPADLAPLLRAIDVDDLPTGLATEVAYAYNWRTWGARELGRNLGRRYETCARPPDPTCEIPLTIDVIGVGESAGGARRGYAGDYKTGHVKYPPPDKFAQTMLGALAVRGTHAVDDAIVELITIHDDGGHHKVRRLVDPWALDTFAAEFQAAMELVDHWELEHAAGRGVGVHEGTHCDYCPAFRQCPAKVGLVRQLPAELVRLGVRPNAESNALEAGPVTLARAGAAWEDIERVEEVLAMMKAEIIKLAWHNDVPLSDGRVIGRVTEERRKVDGRVAGELLETRYGRAARDLYVEPKVTLDAIKRAVVAHLKPGEKIETKKSDGMLDRFLAVLEITGGISTKSTEIVRPHVPKRRLKSG